MNIMTDEIMESMLRLTQASDLDKAEQTEPGFDMSQFEMLEPVSADQISLGSLPMQTNVVIAYPVTPDDRKVLREKKRAIEVGDIIEQAHPEQAILGEAPHGGGVVEDQNEQHAKIVNMVYRNPVGFNFNSWAEAVQKLVKVADSLDSRGDAQAAFRVDALVNELLVQAADQELATPGRDPDEVLPPEAPVGSPRPASKQMPDAPLEGQLGQPGGPLAGKQAPLAPAGNKSIVPYGQSGAAGNARGPSGTGSAGGALTHPSPAGMAAHLPAGGAAEEALHLGQAVVQDQAGSILGKTVETLKGVKGAGKAGLLLGALALAAGGIYALMGGFQSDWNRYISQAHQEVDDHYDSSLKQMVSDMDQTYQEIGKGLADGRADESDLAAIEKLNGLAGQLAAVAPKVSDGLVEAAEHLQKISKDFSDKTAAMLQQAAGKAAGVDTAAKAPLDQKRLKGMKQFFNEFTGDQMGYDSDSDARLEEHVRQFIQDMKKDLGPRFALNATALTEKNLMERGTYEMMKDLERAWQYPKNVIDEMDKGAGSGNK